ncbi:MAG: ribosomal protein L7/L12 [Rhodopirellula sp.]|nr:ribosomal protein L7/L12 [Rhodopirellula sp.]
MNQEDFEEEIRQLLDSGSKIEAIKVYRERTGTGLAEAKDAVEALAAGGTLNGEPSAERIAADDPELVDEVKELLGQGNALLAVKLVRERTGRGLKDSKEIVDKIGVDSGLMAQSGSGCLGAVLLGIAIPVATAWAMLA